VSVTLHGWRHSLYTQAALVVLAEKGVGCDVADVDPFADPQAALAAGHPFGRVPVLQHGAFRIYETQAIGAYVDAAFAGSALTPEAPKARARMVQAIALFDAYGFAPMIAQHYAHAVFAPHRGEPADPAQAASGLTAAQRVCLALEEIAAEGLVLAGPLTLADCHLGPMLRAFALSPDGATLMATCPALDARRREVSARESLRRICLPVTD
jgi:glutathione S-transferase